MAEKLETFDLNLLLALDALLGECHVTRAAARIGLTQSAMSNALSRLREQFGDPLLVRSGREMVKTPFAEQLEEPLRAALVLIEQRVLNVSAFDASSLRRRFVLAMSDYGSYLLLPPLLTRLRTLAPEASVWTVPDHQVLRIDDMMSRAIDVTVGFFWDPPSSIEFEVLYGERLMCLVPADRLGEGEMTLEDYVALPHVLISQTGVALGHVDKFLSGLGKRRRIAATVPHFLSAVEVARACAGVVTLPSRLAQRVAQDERLGMRSCTPPLSLPEWPVTMLWDRGRSAEPEHRFLREQIRLACATASAPG